VSDKYDIVVVGLGAMGAAVAYHAAQLGLSVLGIDRFAPPHDLGSTHAETRISRLAVGEGPQYPPFVARSHELWREFEAKTGESLLHQCGGYIFTEPVQGGERWNDFVTATADIAASAGIEYVEMHPSEVRASHPRILLSDDAKAGFEPTGALIMCERAIAVQIDLARQLGATIRTDERVIAIEPRDGGVEVSTATDTFRCDHAVLATGPWLPDFAAPEHAELLTVTRQVVYWFEVDDLDQFRSENFPFVMWVGETDQDYVSFFPMPPGGIQALKILSEQFLDSTTAEEVDRTVSAEEIAEFHARLVAPKLAGVSANCVKTLVCLYTNTPDDHFLIDADPRSDRITVMSPCSGHGFKHSAALGEAVAQHIATGTSALDLTPFRRPVS
jgi:sarcosine oxidase